MTENIHVDRETIFQEVIERGRNEGIADREAFHDLVEEIIQEHLQVGEMHDDQPTVDISEQLKARWVDYVDAIGLDADQPKL